MSLENDRRHYISVPDLGSYKMESFHRLEEGSSLPPDARELLKPALEPRYRTIRQLNAAVIARQNGAPLSTLSPSELQQLAFGCDTVYFMGTGQQSDIARGVANHYSYEHKIDYPDISLEDIRPSPFATNPGSLDPNVMGSPKEWRSNVYEPLRAMGIRVVLDAVLNHTAIEEAFLQPQAFVTAGDSTVKRWQPAEFYRIKPVVSEQEKQRWVAHGTGKWVGIPWIDTAQLNPYCQEGRELLMHWLDLLNYCDDLRLDMAHLLLRRNFAEKWSSLEGNDIPPLLQSEALADFFVEAQRRAAALGKPAPNFICEAYGNDDRAELANLGYKVSYGKDVYDSMKAAVYGDPHQALLPVVSSIVYGYDPFMRVLLSENHDEPRAASVFGPAATAATAYLALVPGADFMLHQGQEENRLVKVPPQVLRYPLDEKANPASILVHQRIIAFRASRIFQEGEGFIPDHSQLDKGIVATGVKHEQYQMTICTNLKATQQQGMLKLGQGASLVGVCDVMSGRWLTDFDKNHENIFIKIPPYTTQVFISKV